MSAKLLGEVQVEDEVFAAWASIVNAHAKWDEFLATQSADLALKVKSSSAQRSYDIYANPLYVWQAYSLHRAAVDPIPEWVLEYFDRVAAKLSRTTVATASGKRLAKPSTAIAQSLEMRTTGRRGRGNVFSDKNRVDAWPVGYALLVALLLEKSPTGRSLPETHVLSMVAKHEGVSVSTVRRAWNRAKSQIPDYLEIFKQAAPSLLRGQFSQNR